MTVCFQSYSTEVKEDIDFGKAVIMLKCKGINISNFFFFLMGAVLTTSYKAFFVRDFNWTHVSTHKDIPGHTYSGSQALT